MVLPARPPPERVAPQTQLTWLGARRTGRSSQRWACTTSAPAATRSASTPEAPARSCVCGRRCRIPWRRRRAGPVPGAHRSRGAARAVRAGSTTLVDDCPASAGHATRRSAIAPAAAVRARRAPATSAELRPIARSHPPPRRCRPPGRGHVVSGHPFSLGHGREWPLQHWVELARLLNAQDVPVVFTGSGDERDRLAQAWPPPRGCRVPMQAAGSTSGS